MKTKLQIKNVFGIVLFEYESEDNTTKKTLEEAVRQGVDLSYAFLVYVDLSYANLKGYFSKLGQPQTIASLFDTVVMEDLFFFSLSSVLRFSRGRKPLAWQDILKCNGRL